MPRRKKWKIKNGDLIKEKREYILERFRTAEGLWDFFLGTFIWSLLILELYRKIFEYLMESFARFGLNIFIARLYLSALITGIVFTFIGLILSIILIWFFRKVKKVL